MSRTPEILDGVADIVLAYRPEAKVKEPHTRKSRAKPKRKARKKAKR